MYQNKYLNKFKISKKLKKEIARYAISFFFAWLVSALISDFPFFREQIKAIKFDIVLTDLLVYLTENILNLLRLETFSNGNFFKILGTPGLTFAYGCLGIRHLAFFVVFIIFQYGKFKHKLWYIPSGIVLLIFANVLRAVLIAIGQYNNPSQTQLIHDIVSPILMYPTILFLWIFWLSMFGKQVYGK